MKRSVLLMFAACAACALFGGNECTVKASLSGQVFDWTDPNNYDEGVAPQAGKVDQVRIPNNVNVVISNGISQASLDVINGLIRIRPWGENATLTVYVDEGQTLHLDCMVNYNYQSGARGWLVKTGKGTLELTYMTTTANASENGYRVNFDVREGAMKCPQSNPTASSMVVESLTVAKGAFYYPLTPVDYTTIMKGLYGAGTITNEAKYASYKDYKTLNIFGPTEATPAVFSGAIHGLFSLSVAGNQYFTGTNTTTATLSLGNYNSASSYCYGPSPYADTVGVRKFGTQGAYDPVTKHYPSSIGYHQVVFYQYGGHVICLGDEDETTDKLFVTMPPSDDKIRYEFDGGARGGVTFTGTWSMHAGAPNVRRIYLTGSNTAHACVLGNQINKTTKDSNDYSFTFVKEGSGIWRFSDMDNNATKRTTEGLLAVRDGTVEVESITAKGTACCFGTSAKPYPSDYYEKTTDPTKMADYAIELGSTSTTGTLAYVGLSAVDCSTRKIAMTGNGRLENRSGKNFDWSGICTVGTGARTLILDGDDATACNTLDGVTDAGAGALSIVKEGAGTWKVKSNVSLRGDVVVRDGALVLDDETRYTWYKWVIKSTYSEVTVPAGGNSISLTCGEFGLYSEDGRRQSVNLAYRRTYSPATAVYPNLQPGDIDYGFMQADGFAPDTRSTNYIDPTLLCDASLTSGHYLSFWYKTTADQTASGTTRNVPHRDPTEETTWLPIVIRLPEDSLPVTRFDYANHANANAAAVYRTVLYASVNGTDWVEVAPEMTVVPSKSWQLANRPFVEGNDDVHTNALGQVDGQEIAAYSSAATGDFLKDVSSYSVAPGAALKIRSKTTIKGLTVDGTAVGTGRILGGTLASNGTVTLTGLGRTFDPVELPLAFQDVGSLENIKQWTYRLADGKVLNPDLLRVTVANGKVTVSCAAPGLMLLVR